jgi:hypothetical protein
MHLHGRWLNILLRQRGQASAADTTCQTMISGESRCIAPDAGNQGRRTRLQRGCINFKRQPLKVLGQVLGMIHKKWPWSLREEDVLTTHHGAIF